MKKSLTIILAVVILGLIGAISYFAVHSGANESFAEFYMLGIDSKATNYPADTQVGKSSQVTIGVINREQKEMGYRIEVRINDVKNNEVAGIILQPDEKWESPIIFTPYKAGKDQKVEFLLYYDGSSEPYLKPLRLWINVLE